MNLSVVPCCLVEGYLYLLNFFVIYIFYRPPHGRRCSPSSGAPGSAGGVLRRVVGPDPRAGPRTAQEHHGAGPTSPHGLRLQHLLQQEPRPLDQAEGRLPDRRAQVGAGRRRRHPRELQGQDVGRVQDKGRRERWGDDREGGGWRVQRQGSKSEG